MTAPAHLDAIAGRFALAGPIIWVEQLPGGHINDSYRVVARRRSDGREMPYLLQHLNPHVFPDAVRVMENIAYVTRHLEAHRRAGRSTRDTLTLVPTTSGGAWMEDAARSVWRMYAFHTGMHVQARAEQPAEAYEAANAFGEFLKLLVDYDGPVLHVTIEGFHDTAARFQRLDEAVGANTAGRVDNARDEIAELMSHRALGKVLPRHCASGEIPVRVVHNDAKISNVLLDDASGKACCVVDLDTVMPGSLLHDFGDLVRSMTSGADEDEPDLEKVTVRLDLFQAVARGFLDETRAILTPRERELLVFAGRLITLEQGVRFLTDYLDGDRYYRARGDQNLRRTRVHLRLFQSLTEHEPALQDIMGSLA